MGLLTKYLPLSVRLAWHLVAIGFVLGVLSANVGPWIAGPALPVQAAESGGPVITHDSAVPVPILPIERGLFTGSELGDNLIEAGQFIKDNDLCTVYSVDYDNGAQHPVEVIFLRECVGQEVDGE